MYRAAEKKRTILNEIKFFIRGRVTLQILQRQFISNAITSYSLRRNATVSCIRKTLHQQCFKMTRDELYVYPRTCCRNAAVKYTDPPPRPSVNQYSQTKKLTDHTQFVMAYNSRSVIIIYHRLFAVSSRRPAKVSLSICVIIFPLASLHELYSTWKTFLTLHFDKWCFTSGKKKSRAGEFRRRLNEFPSRRTSRAT